MHIILHLRFHGDSPLQSPRQPFRSRNPPVRPIILNRIGRTKRSARVFFNRLAFPVDMLDLNYLSGDSRAKESQLIKICGIMSRSTEQIRALCLARESDVAMREISGGREAYCQ
ncbi:hypothetical protein CDAR_558531 [Caerostris darwini]|uniref:Uncharacterized protein n=1 Tax=Caerostris darwini TaxID=1538125 RepID=A0AAV4S4H3_9ARAC|nr:hypothetical protein CDAR_558531 [Caerostris darwini]